MVERAKRVLYLKDGSRGLYDVLFTYSHRGKSYAMINDNEECRPVFARLKWDIIHGTYINGDVSDEALHVGKGISTRAMEVPEKYPLVGEHYNTRRDGGRCITERKPHSRLFESYCSSIPFVFKMLLLLAMSSACICLYFLFCGFEWLWIVFEGLEKNTFKDIFIFSSLIISLLPYLLNPREASPVLFASYAVMPPIIVTAIGIMKTEPIILYTVMALFLLLCCVYCTLFITGAIKDHRGQKRKLTQDLRDFGFVVIFCLAVVACLIGAFMNVTGYVYMGESFSGLDTTAICDRYEQALESIDPSVWNKLHGSERIQVLQSICDYECAVNLGIEAPTVTALVFLETEVLGSYDHTINTIKINIDYLEGADAVQMVNTLLHETRHAWQYTVVDMYKNIEYILDEKYENLTIFECAREFRKNFENYSSGIEDFSEYYHQAVEMDSRGWAEERMDDVYLSCVLPIYPN